MVKSLSVVTMDVHAGKLLSQLVWRNFNDYPQFGRATATGVRPKLRVGENPLNGKGIPLPRYGEGEEIVYSHVKA